MEKLELRRDKERTADELRRKKDRAADQFKSQQMMIQMMQNMFPQPPIHNSSKCLGRHHYSFPLHRHYLADNLPPHKQAHPEAMQMNLLRP